MSAAPEASKQYGKGHAHTLCAVPSKDDALEEEDEGVAPDHRQEGDGQLGGRPTGWALPAVDVGGGARECDQ